MGLYISPYPSFQDTLAAGQEILRLFRAGEADNDPRHTTAVIMTATVGATGVYPGAPGVAATSLSADQHDQSQSLENELASLLGPNVADLPRMPLNEGRQSPSQGQGQLGGQSATVQSASQEQQQAQGQRKTGQWPEGVPKGPPYTAEQIKVLQDLGLLQSAQPQSVPQGVVLSGQTVQTAQAAQTAGGGGGRGITTAFDPGMITPWIPLLLQLLDRLRKRRGGQ